MNARDLAAAGTTAIGGVLLTVGVALVLSVGYAVLTAGALLVVAGIALGRDTGPPPVGAPGIPEEPQPVEPAAVGAALDTLAFRG